MNSSYQMKKSWGNQHVQDHLNSRNCSRTYDLHRLPCETCFYRMAVEWKTNKINQAWQIHHNSQSMRGERTHDKHGSDVVAVCATCHSRLHAHSTIETRENVAIIIEQIIKRSYEAVNTNEDVPTYLWEKCMEARSLNHTIHRLIKKV